MIIVRNLLDYGDTGPVQKGRFASNSTRSMAFTPAIANAPNEVSHFKL